jgi:asparagine synthase (glutamine-hydrolysing)
MRLAREHRVPVLLNGQGGDELFSGYWPAYYLFLHQHSARSPLRVVEHVLGALLPGGNPMLVWHMLPHFHRYLHRSKRNNRVLLRSHWSSAGFTLTENWAQAARQLESVQYRLAEIRHVHLPRLLKWDDRNSMAFSIEGRYPFLDYRLVEWAVTLPPAMNFRRGWNKLLLRQALNDILPSPIQWRSKVSLDSPQSVWIRTTLSPTILHWVQQPSERLREIVELSKLKELAEPLLTLHNLHKMDERQNLLIRLFFLDRWLELFRLEFPS